MKTLIVLVLSIALAGCSAMTNPFSGQGAYAGLNPPRAHVHTPGISNTDPLKKASEKIHEAEVEPLRQYFLAFEKAKKVDETALKENRSTGVERTPAEVNAMYDYANAGIAMVDSMCLRWFHNMMESQLRLNYTTANRNVIKDLGTTLLGIGAASKDVIAVYGALNTAASGWEQNVSQAFLLAPNANKIKTHVFMAMTQRAGGIKSGLVPKNPKSRATFAEVYSDLEQYADLCTQHTAREIMNTALDQTKTQVSSANEAYRVQTTATNAAVASQVGAISDELARLTQERIDIEKQMRDFQAVASRTRDLEAALEETKNRNRALDEALQSIRNQINRNDRSQVIEPPPNESGR